MKKTLFLALAMVWMAWSDPLVPAAQFEWPTSYTRVRLISVPLDCNWRDGRPFAPREKVAKILKLPTEGSADVDLIEVLDQQGWSVKLDHDQALVAFPPAQAQAGEPGAPIRETGESRLAVSNFIQICASEHKEWVRNDPRQGLLNSVGADLARQARRPVPWTFAIVRSSDPNASCTGEGMVYITTRLLDMLDRDELAGVLAHEVAHGARQQLAEDRNESRRRQVTVRDAGVVRDRAEEAVDRARDQYYNDIRDGRSEQEAAARRDEQVASARDHYKFSMRTINERVQAHQSYSQFKAPTDERQADLVGMRMAAAAGYAPDGLLRALEKLESANFRSYGQRKMLGGRTHPPIGERIKALREILSRWGR